jgi:4-amino-4-deoxy-L-arabinose transferase-like glycosyltransferase
MTTPAASSIPDLPSRYVILSLLTIFSLTILILYWWYIPNYGAGADEASYLLTAKSLATTLNPAHLSPDQAVFVPENMIEARPGVFFAKYSPGYPILCALLYALGNPQLPFLLNPILFLLALVGFFLLARKLLPDLWALAALFFLAFHPVALYFSVAAMSHVSDLAFVTWSMFLALRWFDRPRLSTALLAGFLCGYAVTIRYTEALLALPLIFLAIARLREARRAPSFQIPPKRLALHVLAGALAAIVGMLPLFLYQWAAFGSPFRSGYSLTQESSAFTASFFLSHFPTALYTLVNFPFGLFLVFPVALVAWFFPIPGRRVHLIFFMLWSVPTFLLYSAYYWVNRDIPLLYTRFFLTIFPPLILSALLLLAYLARNLRWLTYSLAALIIALVAFRFQYVIPLQAIQGTAYSDNAAVTLARRNLPPDAVLVAHQFSAYSLVYYTNMTVFYPGYFDRSWVTDRLEADASRRQGITLFNPLRTQRFRDTFANKSQAELDALLRDRLLAYAAQGRYVALLIRTDSDPWYDFLKTSFTFTPIAQDPAQRLAILKLTPTPNATSRP